MKKTSIILCLASIFILSLIPGVFGETLSISPQVSEGVAGEKTELTIMIDRIPDGLSGYNITVTVENPQVAEIVNVSYPGWAAFSYIYPSPPSSYVHMTVSDLTNGIRPGDTYAELGYLTIRALNQGKTAIKIKVNKLNTESGDTIKPAILGATCTVTSGSVPPVSGSTGGGGGGSGIFGSSIPLPSTMVPTVSLTSAGAAETTIATSPATGAPTNEVTAIQTGAVENGGANPPAPVAGSGTEEEGFPWLLIAGAIVAVGLAGLAAIGYNMSREKS